jgi:hypothetical protein
MLFIVGICIIAGAWKTHISSRLKSGSLALKLKQHLLIPAAFNNRHLAPLPYRIGMYDKNDIVSLHESLTISFQVTYPSAPSPCSSEHTSFST